MDRLAVCASSRRVVTLLPFSALSLSRKILDQALLVRARAEGAQVRQGWRVARLERVDNHWEAFSTSGEIIEADQVFVATGKHDLRGMRRPSGRQSDLIGFKVHLDLSETQTAQIRREVSIHLFPGGYAGLELVENGRANLCLLVRKLIFSECGGDWPTLVERIASRCPQLAPILQAGCARRLRPFAISGIPYGHVQSAAEPGIWRLGDQAAVIPSFAGEGMAIALHSAELAAQFFLNGQNSNAYQRTLSRHVRTQVVGATVLSQAMVTPVGQNMIGMALGVSPALAQGVARLTRLPLSARLTNSI